ncbi:hypothetical protein WMF28_09930 [Sorangium sp. So ce590]|uniref:hypothetical protein n=1 Tax=Sorangium sp. So ce590 TaxID=3133317 RepID=UPI003F63AB14
MRGVKARLGTWRAVSEAMDGVNIRTLCRIACGAERGSPALVLLAARVAKTSVERILSPGVVVADRCPSCGRSG